MWIDKSLYWATSLVVGIRAEGSACVLLSSHLSLSSPAFLSGALVCPPLFLLESGFSLRVLAGTLGCIVFWSHLALVWFMPLVFFSVWLHVPCTGLAPWGLASCAVALVGSSPLAACVAGCPLLESLCSPWALFDSWFQVFLLERLPFVWVCSLFEGWVCFPPPFPFFSGLFCFVFLYPDSLALLGFWRCLLGCMFLPCGLPSLLCLLFCD